jgi:hypothetical protein
VERTAAAIGDTPKLGELACSRAIYLPVERRAPGVHQFGDGDIDVASFPDEAA